MKKIAVCLVSSLLFLTACNSTEKGVAQEKDDEYTDDVNSAFNQSQVTLNVKAND